MNKKLNDLLYRTEIGKRIGAWWIKHDQEVLGVLRGALVSLVVYEFINWLRSLPRRLRRR